MNNKSWIWESALTTRNHHKLLVDLALKSCVRHKLSCVRSLGYMRLVESYILVFRLRSAAVQSIGISDR